ncbi:MAG: hypothetical protein ACT4OP_05255 [Actinomycetota bacterium]
MSVEEFELKPIGRDGVEAAIARAEHYRLLNQPQQAESICLDVLEVEPGHQRALVVLTLAITDQFGGGAAGGPARAKSYLEQLTDLYDRNYYAGIVAEREGRAYLERGHARVFAYDGLRRALTWFEKASELRPSGNDDAILRWNACVRTIRREKLTPREPEAEHQLE